MMCETRDSSEWWKITFLFVVTALCWLCIVQSALAGSIVGWGSMAVDSNELDANNFIAIAAGEYRNLVLKSDGSLFGWGYNVSGQATPPEGNDFVAITAGESHSLALKSDGSIVGWGNNAYGQATPPDGNDFVAIAAGGGHSLALKSDGSIVGWGWDNYGQATPPDGNDFVAIAAGGRHSLALKTDGSIIGWGWDNYGQATPPDRNDFVAIAGDWRHSLALKADGTIVGWGYNYCGQATPPAGTDFVAIAAGWIHSLAIRRNPPIEAQMNLTPKALNCKSRGEWVKAHFVIPADLKVEDVDSNSPGQIDSLGVESDHIDVFVGEDGLIRVDMAFDRAAFCDGLTEGGSIEISVKGLLTNGYYFYGTDTIKIIDNIFEHLAFLSSQWLREDCSKPDWCQDADIDQDSVVNLYDFAFMAYQWLEDNLAQR